MIVDLAVEANRISAVHRSHGLAGFLRQIQNCQAPVGKTQTRIRGRKNSFAIRTTVSERFPHTRERLTYYGLTIKSKFAGDSTHIRATSKFSARPNRTSRLRSRRQSKLSTLTRGRPIAELRSNSTRNS